MLKYCPTCANLLLVEKQPGRELRSFCQVCPYVYIMRQKVSYNQPLEIKQVEPVLGGEEEWSAMPKTNAVCPKCQHDEARFQEIQTRSADEPASLFFRCMGCGHNWREG